MGIGRVQTMSKPVVRESPSQPEKVVRESADPQAHDTGTTSLLRALAILELISQKSGGFSNGEISRRLKIATSSTSYILSRLEREGYIKRTKDRGRYEIGLKVIALAHGALREMGLRKAAEPILHRVVAETRCSSLIGVIERGLVMIVDKVEQPELSMLDMDIGVRYPVHTTALGKILIAHMPEDELTSLFDKYSAAKFFRQSVETRANLMRELATVKKQGYAISNGELFLGVRAIAAPIFDSAGTVRAAVSVAGVPRPADESAIIACITRSAREISLRLAAAEAVKLPRL